MDTNITAQQQLGQLLRARREQIGPQQVGLPQTRRRRTPGLRREEVAMLAGISTTYYTKIEQGRIAVSEQALSDIMRVLKFNHGERAYAFALARGRTARHPDYPEYLEERISPALQSMLVAQNPNPAQIMGRRWDILAWNQASCAVLGDMDAMPPEARNLMRIMFTTPGIEKVIVDWEVQAPRALAQFQADYITYQDDPAFSELVADLQQQSAPFRAWWGKLDEIGGPAEFTKPIMHPQAGLLELYETIFTVKAYPNLRLMLFTPQTEETGRKLQQLYAARLAALSESAPVLREPEPAYGD